MLQIYPSLRPVDLDEMYEDLLGCEGSPYVVVNVVTTADGRAAIEGRSSPIGSETDHRLMRRLRSLVDAVLTGSGTLRQEGVDTGVPESLEAYRARRGLRPQPLAVVIGGQQGVRLRGKLQRLGPESLVLFLPLERAQESAPLAGALYELPGSRIDVAEAARILAERHGVRRLLVEGGPSINGSFLLGGLVDELFWT
ncbi:MAG: RibD family protein, partial [Chloroflexota bacterium]|nr:RibD family protein [Chloroflexota bacterium]